LLPTEIEVPGGFGFTILLMFVKYSVDIMGQKIDRILCFFVDIGVRDKGDV